MKRRYIAAAAALLLVLTSCGKTAVNADFEILLRYSSDDEYNETVMSYDSFEAVRNDRFSLSVNTKTAAVTVTDMENGGVYETNPASKTGAQAEVPSNRSAADSQIIITFLDSSNSNQQNTWNSYDQCIAKNQYSFYPVENGIGVNYFFGEMPEDILVPEIMSEESYRKISENMDESDRSMLEIYYTKVSLDMYDSDKSAQSTMEQRYPILRDQDVYILQMSFNISFDKLSKDQLGMVENVLLAGGYSAEDYERDTQLSEDSGSVSAKLQLSVALEYVLTDDGFTVTVPSDSISYDTSAMTLIDMSVLPDFEAVSVSEDAQFFVPDGCGALINSNNGVNKDMDYRQRVYGEDELLMTSFSEDPQNSEICLPVFGALRGTQSFLAVITEGEGYAYINASVSGEATNYNRVYASFVPRAYVSQTSNAIEDTQNYVSAKTELSKPISIKYTLFGSGCDYKTLAFGYRDYLIENDMLKKSGTTYDVDLFIINSVIMQDSIIGIPVTGNESVTDFEQTGEIIDEIASDGRYAVSTVLLAWCNGGSNNSLMTSVNPLSVLGGDKLLEGLLEKGGVYEGVNFFSAKKSGKSEKYSARDINGLSVSVYDFFSAEKQENYIISPSYYTDIAKKFIEANSRYGKNLCDLYSAKLLSADYNENLPVDRQDAVAKSREMLEVLKNGSETLKLCGANSYAFEFADTLSDIPLRSSGKYIFNEEVPFLQIVLSGMLPYSGEALNLSDNYRASLLRCIELGAIPRFELMHAENTELVNSPENRYSVNYDMWREDLMKACEISRKCREATDGSRIIDYVSDGIFSCTTYENGVKIYVNYADSPAETPEGETVEATGYIVTGN